MHKMPSELINAFWRKTCNCYAVIMLLDPGQSFTRGMIQNVTLLPSCGVKCIFSLGNKTSIQDIML